jgi:hypothetical protein
MDHRVKSGGDESKSDVTVAWHSSDAQPHRENGCTHPPPCKRGRGTMPTGPARSGRPDDKLRMVEGASDLRLTNASTF